MAKCTVKSCNNPPYREQAECVLHCKKNDYSTDWHSGLLSSFYDALKADILDFLKDNDYSYSQVASFKDVAQFVDGDFSNENIASALKDALFIPTFVIFPAHDDRDSFNYTKLLNIFGEIHFNICEFTASHLQLKDAKVFFQDCVFHDSWSLYNYSILENVNNVIYQNCIFKGSVSNKSSETDLEPYVLTENQFDSACSFGKDLSIHNSIFEQALFNINEASFYGVEEAVMTKLDIRNTTFKDKFILNKANISDVYIQNCVFEGKFEFKENLVKEFEIDNADFLKVSDFFSTQFNLFKIKQVKFESFAAFENCIFGLNDNSKAEYWADFVYTTFMGFVNFRYTRFLSGLNLEKANFMQSPNFLKSEINPLYTNRETFRIIKSSFSKLENIIDSNKYYSKELEKYREELNSSDTAGFEEKLIFNANHLLSSFGQSYLKPICWIIVLAVLHYLVVIGYENSWLYRICEPCNDNFAAISAFLNKVAANILPFKASLKEGLEFASLIFTIGYAILIWQVIAALKIHTRKH